jgi:flagellar FliL protein
MAEEEIQESGAVQSPPPKKKKGFLKTLLIVLVAAGLAGGAGYYFYGKTVMSERAQKRTLKDEARDDRKDNGRTEIGPIVSLDPFVMNVSGNSSRFVKMAVALEVRDAKTTEEVKKMTPAIRDAMLGVLGAKPPEAFMDVTGREAMKKELFDSVSGFFTKGDLQAVYITDLIMQ